MSEEKPFEPTQQKINKARKEGNVAKSSELNGIVTFGAGMMALSAVAPQMSRALGAWITTLASSNNTRLNASPLLPILGFALIPIIVSGAAGVLTGTVQTGGFVFVAPSLKLERLNPGEGIKRMVSPQALIGVGKGLIAFVIAAVAVTMVVRKLVNGGAIGSFEPGIFAAIASAGIRQVIGTTLVIGAVSALIDVFITRQQWRKKLRMDFNELKRETKESEGDPHVKGRRRSMQRSMLSGPVKRVADANFVVTNPTHIAVALQYAPPDVPVPVVLCMAADESAQVARELAREHSIPIVENVPLARSLFETAEVDRTIPRETFVAVAEIVSALTRTGAL